MEILESLLAYSMEGFLMAGVGPALLGKRLKLKTMLLIAVMYGSLIYGVRNLYFALNIALGTHAIILFISLGIIFRYIGKLKAMESAVATLINAALLFIGEGVFMFPLFSFIEVDPVKIIGKPGDLFILTLAADGLLVIAFIIFYVFKFPIFNFDRLNKLDEV